MTVTTGRGSKSVEKESHQVISLEVLHKTDIQGKTTMLMYFIIGSILNERAIVSNTGSTDALIRLVIEMH